MHIVDYGCGPGTSAVTAVATAVETYRSQFPLDAVVVCHADQPGNDWSALFTLVFGPSGYRSPGDGVRTEAAVGSFYDQMRPVDSVDLATCFAASHWLSSAVHLAAPGTVWFADLTGEARRELADRARRDWTTFLHMRARELRAGGYLFVSTLGSVPDPTEINGAAASGRGIYRAMQAVAQSMADDGLLDDDVLDRFVFSLWFMTADEAITPLEEDTELAATFDVEHIDITPAPHNPTDVFADLVTDPEAYAHAYTGYIRAFADSTLRAQLFEPSARDPQHADELNEVFFERLHDLYRTHLDDYAFELWGLTVVLRRRARLGP